MTSLTLGVGPAWFEATEGEAAWQFLGRAALWRWAKETGPDKT